MTPVVEIIEMLLKIFPDSTESMAVDVVPIDEMADPETWEGTSMMMMVMDEDEDDCDDELTSFVT